MKHQVTRCMFALAMAAVFIAVPFIILYDSSTTEPESPGEAPNDWFFRQRAFPDGRIDNDAYAAAQRQAGAMHAFAKTGFNGGEWQFAGPTNIGGRVTAIDVVRSNIRTMYVGTAAGGVFKTTDGGENWRPIFDSQPSLSIGDVTIDPNDTNVIYVGTGEPNGALICYGGAGVFRSTDGGESWQGLGLERTRHISRVVVDHRDPRRIYVAAMGEMYSSTPERGLYRTTDGGTRWEKVFHVNDSTGCIDMVMHPTNPDLLYIAMWESQSQPRTIWESGGHGSDVYRSTNGGEHWEHLQGTGLPGKKAGRIGLAIAASSPDRLYALYCDSLGGYGGIYRSNDGGDSWSRTSDQQIAGPFCSLVGNWFGNIRVNPKNPDEVYALGFDMWRSGNGGGSWTRIGRIAGGDQMHVDQHDLYIHPDNPSFMVEGNDGGVYISEDGGNLWRHVKNFGATQFYTCEVDYQHPERIYGGTQDNYTLRTLTGRIDDWHDILYGDGMVVLVDPTDNRYVYAEAQSGAIHRSIDGGLTMERAGNGIASLDRFNWVAPIVLDPQTPSTLYFGSQRVYRSTDRALTWTPISQDLTNSEILPGYGTITTIAVAPTDPDVIYVGTDDANVWVTTNGGEKWIRIDKVLPQRWVTRLAVDPRDDSTVYATFSGYRNRDYQPHIMKSTDGGWTWSDVSGNLPEAPINDVIVDPASSSTLIVATDVGIFYTSDGGAVWMPLGTGLPNVPVHDITLHHPTRKLVAATHGRSMYTLDVSFLSGIEARKDAESRERSLTSAPNPFRTSTTLSFTLPESGDAELDIHDITGRRVRRLFAGRMEQGNRSFLWDGRTDAGAPAPPGTYICRLRTRNVMLAGNTVLIR